MYCLLRNFKLLKTYFELENFSEKKYYLLLKFNFHSLFLQKNKNIKKFENFGGKQYSFAQQPLMLLYTSQFLIAFATICEWRWRIKLKIIKWRWVKRGMKTLCMNVFERFFIFLLCINEWIWKENWMKLLEGCKHVSNLIYLQCKFIMRSSIFEVRVGN